MKNIKYKKNENVFTKEKQMLELIGDIDDDLIEKSKPSGIKRHRIIRTGILSTAAVLALLVGTQYRFLAKPLMDMNSRSVSETNSFTNVKYMDIGMTGEGYAYPLTFADGKLYSAAEGIGDTVMSVVREFGVKTENYFAYGISLPEKAKKEYDPKDYSQQICCDDKYMVYCFEGKLSVIDMETREVKLMPGKLASSELFGINDRIIGIDSSHNIYMYKNGNRLVTAKRSIVKLDTDLNVLEIYNLGLFSNSEIHMFDSIERFRSLSAEGDEILIECENGETVRYNFKAVKDPYNFREKYGAEDEDFDLYLGTFDRKVSVSTSDNTKMHGDYECQAITYSVPDSSGENTILTVYDIPDEQPHFCKHGKTFAFPMIIGQNAIVESENGRNTELPFTEIDLHAFRMKNGDILKAGNYLNGFGITIYDGETFEEKNRYTYQEMYDRLNYISTVSVTEDSSGTLYALLNFEGTKEYQIWSFGKDGSCEMITALSSGADKIAVMPDDKNIICHFPSVTNESPESIFEFVNIGTRKITPVINEDISELSKTAGSAASLQDDGTAVYILDGELYEYNFTDMNKTKIMNIGEEVNGSISTIVKGDNGIYYFDSDRTPGHEMQIRYVKAE